MLKYLQNIFFAKRMSNESKRKLFLDMAVLCKKNFSGSLSKIFYAAVRICFYLGISMKGIIVSQRQ